MTTQNKKDSPSQKIGLLGCVGGLFTQLVCGAIYQWGIINIYITSFYKLNDGSLTLEQTSIASPIMLLCSGLTIGIGMYLARTTHPLIVMVTAQVLQAVTVFVSSFMANFWLFVLFYGILFGLISGIGFMIPIFECNKFLVGKKMYVNGFILIGTGLGAVVFGEFSYNFINPDGVSPINGYYIGSPAVEQLIQNLPVLIRWHALLYLVIGLLGSSMLAPVILHNRRVQIQHEKHRLEKQAAKAAKQQTKQEIKNHGSLLLQVKVEQAPKTYGSQLIHHQKYDEEKKKKHLTRHQRKHMHEAHSIMEAMKSKIFWVSNLILLMGSAGVFLINSNYKTYVKSTIQDDEFLTTIGVIGSVGNGCSRFFWNLLFNKTGYKTVLLTILTLCMIVFSTIRFTVDLKEVYLVEVFIVNCCLGGFLVSTPTASQSLYGHNTGSSIYGIYLEMFGAANLVSYLYVSLLSHVIGFNNVIYVCLGMVVLAMPLVIMTKYQGPWENDTSQLGFCTGFGVPKELQHNHAVDNSHKVGHIEVPHDPIISDNIIPVAEEKNSKQESTRTTIPSFIELKTSKALIPDKESKQSNHIMDFTSLHMINQAPQQVKQIQRANQNQIDEVQQTKENGIIVG